MATVFRLAELLTQLGVTQQDLADRSGLNVRTIGRLCRNDTVQVHLETLDRIAVALGVDPCELLGRKDARRR